MGYDVAPLGFATKGVPHERNLVFLTQEAENPTSHVYYASELLESACHYEGRQPEYMSVLSVAHTCLLANLIVSKKYSTPSF